jgi:hypothetical protein
VAEELAVKGLTTLEANDDSQMMQSYYGNHDDDDEVPILV